MTIEDKRRQPAAVIDDGQRRVALNALKSMTPYLPVNSLTPWWIACPVARTPLWIA